MGDILFELLNELLDRAEILNKISKDTSLPKAYRIALEDVDPIYIADNQADGLYDVYPFKDDELGNPIGTVGVDTCQVGIFKKKDIPKRHLNNLKPYLYTEIQRFKGKIIYYESEGGYTLVFEGKETFVIYL